MQNYARKHGEEIDLLSFSQKAALLRKQVQTAEEGLHLLVDVVFDCDANRHAIQSQCTHVP